MQAHLPSKLLRVLGDFAKVYTPRDGPRGPCSGGRKASATWDQMRADTARLTALSLIVRVSGLLTGELSTASLGFKALEGL